MAISGRISGSWAAKEIEAGATLIRALLAGTDVRVMARDKRFQKFARQVLKLDARREQRIVEPKPVMHCDQLLNAARALGTDRVTVGQLMLTTGWPKRRVWNAIKTCCRRGEMVRVGTRGRFGAYIVKPAETPIARTA